MEVGRSSIVVEHKGYSLMLDCGIRVETMECPAQPDHIDSLILSHAHLDHSGMIPAMHKSHGIPIYSTDLTFELSHLLQMDSIKIGKLKKQPLLYSETDVANMHASENSVGYRNEKRLNSGISFEFYDAGHIPGSASILLNISGKIVLYTGDIKTKETYLQKGAEIPEAEILIIESTYGDRIHPKRSGMEKEFRDKITETLNRGGIALIPAFAVGRSQEILMVLKDIGYPLYLDGLAKDITRIFLGYPEYIRDPKLLQDSANDAIWIEHNNERRDILSEPCIIVTTAGMLSGGPVLYYLQRLHRDRNNSIFLTGYQVKGTNGRLLMDEGYVIDPLDNSRIRVEMEKHQFDFSAHAGRNSLKKIVKIAKPETVIVVHGDPDSCISFGGWLRDYGKNVYIPAAGDTIEL